jgi:hypothetical protein
MRQTRTSSAALTERSHHAVQIRSNVRGTRLAGPQCRACGLGGMGTAESLVWNRPGRASASRCSVSHTGRVLRGHGSRGAGQERLSPLQPARSRPRRRLRGAQAVRRAAFHADRAWRVTAAGRAADRRWPWAAAGGPRRARESRHCARNHCRRRQGRGPSGGAGTAVLGRSGGAAYTGRGLSGVAIDPARAQFCRFAITGHPRPDRTRRESFLERSGWGPVPGLLTARRSAGSEAGVGRGPRKVQGISRALADGSTT